MKQRQARPLEEIAKVALGPRKDVARPAYRGPKRWAMTYRAEIGKIAVRLRISGVEAARAYWPDVV